MIAEELQIRAQSGYIGGSAGLTGGGFLTNLSVAMLFSSMVSTISQTLAKGPILYGKYRYDWLNTFYKQWNQDVIMHGIILLWDYIIQ